MYLVSHLYLFWIFAVFIFQNKKLKFQKTWKTQTQNSAWKWLWTLIETVADVFDQNRCSSSDQCFYSLKSELSVGPWTQRRRTSSCFFLSSSLLSLCLDPINWPTSWVCVCVSVSVCLLIDPPWLSRSHRWINSWRWVTSSVSTLGTRTLRGSGAFFSAAHRVFCGGMSVWTEQLCDLWPPAHTHTHTLCFTQNKKKKVSRLSE